MNRFRAKYPLAVLLLVFLGLTSCAPSRPSWTKFQYEPGTIVTADRLRQVPQRDLIEDLKSADVVYVGEQHDHPASHRVQQTILENLQSNDGGLTIGFELFRENRQELLDRWVKGELTEEQFREDLSGKEGGSPLFSYYADILWFARRKEIPLVALKPSRRSVNDFRKSFSSESSSRIIESPQATFLKKSFEQHVPTGQGFQRFLAVQQFWEDRMARTLHRSLVRNDSVERMLVLTGNFHVAYDFAIPDKLSRLGEYRQRSVLTLPVDQSLSQTFLLEPSDEEKTTQADYVWWIPPKNSEDK